MVTLAHPRARANQAKAFALWTQTVKEYGATVPVRASQDSTGTSQWSCLRVAMVTSALQQHPVSQERACVQPTQIVKDPFHRVVLIVSLRCIAYGRRL